MLRDWIYENIDVVKEVDDEIICVCPLCDDDSGHLYINVTHDSPFAHCFKCEFRPATWLNLVCQVEGVSPRVALSIVGGSYTPRVRNDNLFNYIQRSLSSPDEVEILDEVIDWGEVFSLGMPEAYISLSSTKLNTVYHRYLKRRKISDGAIDRYGIGFASGGKYSGRIIIPCSSRYFQARSISDMQNPKYLNPSKKSGGSIFNPQALKYEAVNIAEGAFSALAIGDDTIALLGKSVTSKQISILRNSGVGKFTVILDSDAEKSSWDIAHKLANFAEVDVVGLANGDPADDGVQRKYCMGYNPINELKARLMLC